MKHGGAKEEPIGVVFKVIHSVQVEDFVSLERPADG